jgi:hypothetical protein
MDKSDIIEALKTSIVDVEFIKKDGTVRLMTCTLREDSLPKQEPKNIDEILSDLAFPLKEKPKNEESIAVFDTINQGWRSFRWDSLISVNGVIFDPVWADEDVPEYFIV